MEKEFIHPETLSNYPNAFTQVVTVKSRGVKTIYVSGQVAIDSEGKVIGEGDIAAQADQVFKNLTLALDAAGAAPEDAIKINAYIVDLTPEKVGAVAQARRQHFSQPNLPASTWIGVQALVSPAFMLEVEAIAVVEE